MTPFINYQHLKHFVILNHYSEGWEWCFRRYGYVGDEWHYRVWEKNILFAFKDLEVAVEFKLTFADLLV